MDVVRIVLVTEDKCEIIGLVKVRVVRNRQKLVVSRTSPAQQQSTANHIYHLRNPVKSHLHRF